ncbi:MAG TPA: c-type cytochrome [Terriglobales bacterium]
MMLYHFRRRFLARVAVASMLACGLGVAVVAQDRSAKASSHPPPPYWAYPVDPPAHASRAQFKSIADTPQHVPNSTASFTLAQIGDLYTAPDWHPDAHPAMPDIVGHGRKPEVYACGYCHLPNGQGRPENSSLAGLPVGYMAQQMADFKSGLRKSSVPEDLPVATMVANETKANDQEIEAAAAYFSALKPKPWTRVVETRTVPKTHIAGWMLVVSKPITMEPIGQRIIETPENLERTELRDDTSGFIAYVPVGSIKKGKTQVSTGGAGKTMACATCHGVDLRGSGDVPSIAGRLPSYIVRQLYDIQSGARAGAATQLMNKLVANLTLDDMISIAAYTASLHP